MKKALTGLLALSICLGILSGCAASSKSSTPDSSSSQGGEVKSNGVTAVGTYPIVEEPLTLSIMGRKDPGAPNWDELEVFKRLTNITGISFDFEMAETETFAEQKNIALVGGEYAGMIWRDDTAAITDEETYGPQGIFIDLTDLIEEYAPNLKKLLADRPDVKAAITAMDGSIYGLPYVFDTATTQGHTGFFDEQWMKNVGIDKVPETTDELYAMLKAFKEQDANGNGDPNDEIPMTTTGMTTTMRDLLIPAFTGLPDGLSFNVDNGDIVYAPATAKYKDFLVFAHKLYSEGLLDAEFSTQTSQQWQAKVKGGLCGVYSASPTLMDPATTTTQQLSLPPLTSENNSVKSVRRPYNLYPGRAFITDKCENPVAAIRLLDMFYATPDNAVEGFSGQTTFLGFENEHWQYTDSTKEAYEWIAPITGFGDINKSISVNMELPGYLSFLAMPSGNPLMDMKVEQVKTMQKPYYKDAYPVNARFTEDESERGNVYENDIYSYVVMMSTKFITGEESTDNFDQYLATLDKMGLQDLLQIKRDAYDRYKANLTSAN